MRRVATCRTVVLALVLALGCADAAAADGAVPATAAHNYRDPHFDYFASGDPHAARASHTEFGLVLMGGGGRLAAAFEAIATRAGHGHIVILRAVSDDSFDPDDGDYGRSFAAEWGPVASAETIVFHDRQAAYDPRVLAALKGADGIFLAGGDQANYVRYWKGTPVQDLLNAHVAANRPIGGSSAGLAILGHYSYTAYDGGSMESKVALANPFDSGVTLEADFLDYRGLERVLTDTHFSARSRLGRLIVFLARLRAERPASGAYGIGIDERTALLVDADGSARLLPGSAGSAWIVVPPATAEAPVAGEPLTLRAVQILRMDGSSTLDLRSATVRRPAAATSLDIVDGRPGAPSFATSILARDSVPPDED